MSSSRTEALAPVAERLAPTPEEFRAEILPVGKPMVLRGVARDWPLVIAALQDARHAMSLLEARANGQDTKILRTEPAEEGRFHYGKDLRSFNFIRGQGSVADILASLRDQECNYRPFAMAAQAMIAERYFPGFSQTHPMPFVPADGRAARLDWQCRESRNAQRSHRERRCRCGGATAFHIIPAVRGS